MSRPLPLYTKASRTTAKSYERGYFTKLTLNRDALPMLVELYEDWFLGMGRFASLRERRVLAGMQSSTSRNDIQSRDTLIGSNEFRIDRRSRGNLHLFRMSHADAEHPGRSWNNLIQITVEDNLLVLMHGSRATVHHASTATEYVSSPPKIISEILSDPRFIVFQSDLQPRQPMAIAADEVKDFVRMFLISEKRVVPYVVVSSLNSVDKFLINCDVLSKNLRGLAPVYYLTNPDAAYAFTETLTEAGFAREFSCYDGGLRLYHTRMSPKDDLLAHPLWTKTFLNRSASNIEAAELLSNAIADRLSRSGMPVNYWMSIEEFDRHFREFGSRLLTTAHSLKADRDSAALKATQIHSDNVYYKQLVDSAMEEEEKYRTDQKIAEEKAFQAQARVDQLSDKNRSLESKLAYLEERLKTLEKGENSTSIGDVRSKLIETIESNTPHNVLQAFSILYGERIRVLESAFESALTANQFKEPKKLVRLLNKFVTGYFESLAEGKPDAEARKCFGKDEFAATESERTRADVNCENARTFTVDGKAVTMWSHLKLGKNSSPTESLRIHFHWQADQQILVIGYCGKHLPTFQGG